MEQRIPVAWSGQLRTQLIESADGTGVVSTPFYTVLQVSATRGSRRAVALALIHAEAPANRIARALDDQISGTKLVESFRFGLPADSTGELIRSAAGTPLMRIDATPVSPGLVSYAATTRARARGIILFAVAVLLMLGFAWTDRRALGFRVVAVVIALVAIALVPWNNFSNYFRAFDPAYYYIPGGGPFTANAGVLGISAALVLLAVFAIVRAPHRRIARPLAWAAALVAAGVGVATLLLGASGISLPRSGSSISLWLSWEVPLFLILFACWLTAAWLIGLGGDSKGAPRMKTAALLATVAATLTAFVVWQTTTDQRRELAERDVASLQVPDGDAATLLERFAFQFLEYDSPGTRADLLKRYVKSDLAAADLQVSLGSWSKDRLQESRLDLASLPYDSAALSLAVTVAATTGKPIIRQVPGPAGREVMLAVPHRGGGATSVVVSPRTRLIEQNPYLALLGLDMPSQAEPPYTLTLADVAQIPGIKPGRLVWRKNADEWHGDELIATSRGEARAHVEVDLRSRETRFVRGWLVVTLDVAIAGLLWALGAMAEGGFWRWVRRRTSRWLRSYRGRLSLALFLFFIVPAVAFATWSYQRLRGDDRGVRELLVYETLHRVAGDRGDSDAQSVSDDTPLFLYSSGMLVGSSDTLYTMIAPGGRALPSAVQMSLATGGELTASWQQTMAKTNVFWGYRATTGVTGQRFVLSAPARSDELVLDRRRRDLTLLVLFATALGALAAFWLSGVAARILARDLELSRIEVSRAERVLAWGEMARQVAHEIKNPLTPIRLGVQHLRRARSDPRVDFDKVLNENVTRILSEIDHLDEIARAFSRYGSAPADLPPAEEIDAAAIIRDVVGLEKIGISGVSWILEGAEGAVFARARNDELRDVLLNVFENARLARARTVRVRLARDEKVVTVTVSDDGAGIPSAALNRVFEPHFSTRTTGSGLGLAISRRLLESWGGTIDLESVEGRGARVSITMQAAAP
ncbi:MAG TPA: HAMP domain-containing sensor histidine kinase [Gemmatimonadaceae bacterium]|nr:HAMP domain-containing sensor histidine kinase [Gemmatimonadaceae bacterium]